MGIIKVEHILNHDGSINVHRIQNLVTDKRNFLTTQHQLQLALRPYRLLFNPMYDQPESHQKTLDLANMRTRDYYRLLLNLNEKNVPLSFQKWEIEFDETFEISRTFLWKVKLIKETKIAAFNFKILHKILICGHTLHTWRKIESPLCTTCKVDHTVQHMLWDCKNANFVWGLFNRHCIACFQDSVPISWFNLVMGTGNKQYDNFVSILAFIIYKAWILEINNKMKSGFKYYFWYELNHYMNVYRLFT